MTDPKNRLQTLIDKSFALRAAAEGKEVPKEEKEEITSMATVTTQTETATKRRGRPAADRDAGQALLDLVLVGAGVKVNEAIAEYTSDAINELRATLDKLAEDIKTHKRVEIKYGDVIKEIKGRTHQTFESLLKVASTGHATMLVGPAGSGKTFASEQVAEALNRTFHAISVGSQTSKLDLLGYMNATGEYIRTQFRDAYEHGGVFLMDEIDAGNANVLIVLNSALAGKFCAFPDKMVTKHENFIFIATANTYGTGASRQYVGRNQIDAATLDRFVTIDWPVDEILEAATVSGFTQGEKWHKVVKKLRKYAAERDYRVIISPRATMKGAALLEQDFSFDQVVEMVILPTAATDIRSSLKDAAKDAWKY